MLSHHYRKSGWHSPHNEPFKWEFITIFRFNDEGTIVEEWAQTNVLSFLTQLDVPLPTQ